MFTMLAVVAFGLTHALDTGWFGKVGVEEMKAKVADGTVLDFLTGEVGVDLSLLHNDDRAELLREWQTLADVVDEARKLGVERDGLCLLLAYTLEGMQQRGLKAGA